MIISFTVPAVPVAQPRQRHAMIAGHVRNYLPSKHPVNDFKATVRMAWQAAYRAAFENWDASKPMHCYITAVFPRPKSKTTKRGPNNREAKTSKPDFDNVAKAVCDALTGLAWNDDAQIYDARVAKFIAGGDEQPHVVITIQAIEHP